MGSYAIVVWFEHHSAIRSSWRALIAVASVVLVVLGILGHGLEAARVATGDRVQQAGQRVDALVVVLLVQPEVLEELLQRGVL